MGDFSNVVSYKKYIPPTYQAELDYFKIELDKEDSMEDFFSVDEKNPKEKKFYDQYKDLLDQNKDQKIVREEIDYARNYLIKDKDFNAKVNQARDSMGIVNPLDFDDQYLETNIAKIVKKYQLVDFNSLSTEKKTLLIMEMVVSPDFINTYYEDRKNGETVKDYINNSAPKAADCFDYGMLMKAFLDKLGIANEVLVYSFLDKKEGDIYTFGYSHIQNKVYLNTDKKDFVIVDLVLDTKNFSTKTYKDMANRAEKVTVLDTEDFINYFNVNKISSQKLYKTNPQESRQKLEAVLENGYSNLGEFFFFNYPVFYNMDCPISNKLFEVSSDNIPKLYEYVINNFSPYDWRYYGFLNEDYGYALDLLKAFYKKITANMQQTNDEFIPAYYVPGFPKVEFKLDAP